MRSRECRRVRYNLLIPNTRNHRGNSVNFANRFALHALSRRCYLAVLLAVGSFAMQTAAAQSVFINEIHYDNTGTDVDERIEVAGPARTDLRGRIL